MNIDPIMRRIIEATQSRFDACRHNEIVDPPRGKYLRVCLGCGCRLIECALCDAKTFARADIADFNWRVSGSGTGPGISTCPRHER